MVASVTSFAGLVSCSTDRVGRGWFRRPPASSGWCLLLPVSSKVVSSGAGSSADSFVWLVSPATSFIRYQFPLAGVFSSQFHRGQVGSWQVRLHLDWTLVHRHLKRGDGKG
ncbi:unnamed protein product [Ixodes pacificus]